MARALVIGAETASLVGVNHDARAVAAWLTSRGFTVDLRLERNATRDAALDGMRALIEDARPDAAAVVYYAGHGGLLQVEEPAPSKLGYLAPTDHDPRGPFRGITELEWSGLVAALTARTRNVAVIHDCCHAARTVRGAPLPGARARALAPVQISQDELRTLAGPAREAIRHPLGNPDAIRLTAASGHGLAWERMTTSGRAHGVFTAALLGETGALDGRATSWAELGRRVRDRVLRATGRQRPEIEGPVSRRVFGLDVLDAAAGIPVRPQGRHSLLAAGCAHGVKPGDVFRSTCPPHQIAVVTRVGVLESEVRVEPPAGAPHAFEAVAARPATRDAVAIDADDADLGRAIADVIQCTPRLCTGDPADAIAVIRVECGRLLLLDDHGPLCAPIETDAGGLSRAAAALSRLAETRVLQRIAARFGAPDELAMTVERAGAGSRELDDDAELSPDDRLCVHLTNRTRRTLWLHGFAAGHRPAAEALGPLSSGTQLEPGATEILGAVPGAGSVGFTLARPAGGRVVELIAIATTAPSDLTSLAVPAHGDGGAIATTLRVATSPVEAARDVRAAVGEHRVIAARRRFRIST